MATVDEACSIQEAFEDAVHRHSRRLFGLALTILRDRIEAEDAVQETMSRAWRAWGSVRDEDTRAAWLTRICVNHCISRRRGLRATRLLLQRAGTDTQFLLEHSTFAVDGIDLDRVFRCLSPKQRVVVTLHYHHGYSLDECGRLMGCRPGTVRSHLARALTTLRRELSHV